MIETSGMKDVILHLSGLYKIYSKKLEKEIRNGDIPNHLALILDGNRRWAKKNLSMKNIGHWRGADAVENLLDWCEEFDIKIITLYALSAENLDRKDDELEYLYKLIKNRLEKLCEDPRIHRNKMRVKAIGRIELLPESIKEVLRRLDELTKNYNDQIGDKLNQGRLKIDDINKQEIESNLYTSHLPQSSPDLILRTSGEKRLSGFLMWQSAYSELVFMDILWPEFRKIDLMRAIRTYQKRKRRLGK
jgi:tritrans,polycis-undecaprenyl-diphosphate synthase [geranylgeranyl-diphosphate specific]